MSRRDWKKLRPRSLPHAMELCLAHAKERHNRSVEQVADLMALPNKWRLYKWVENADMPSRHILGFEHACGIDYMTQYHAHSGRRLLIDIPTGRPVEAEDLHRLQAMTNDAVGALIAFASGGATADEVIAATTHAMEGLAWHRANVEKHLQPELELDA
ncbi:MAG: hypothetical protein PHY45_11815 [Rhodocyclaceae bacterium]|nr:hypothetical protein [Rhodocyclaceae bacterium]